MNIPKAILGCEESGSQSVGTCQLSPGRPHMSLHVTESDTQMMIHSVSVICETTKIYSMYLYQLFIR